MRLSKSCAIASRMLDGEVMVMSATDTSLPLRTDLGDGGRKEPLSEILLPKVAWQDAPKTLNGGKSTLE